MNPGERIQPGFQVFPGWFLFADPTEKASILRLREKNGNQRPRMGWVNLPGKMQKGYFVNHVCGFSAVSRDGVFRGGV